MIASQPVRDLQHRCFSLLEDPVFVFTIARQDRAAQKVRGLEDAVIAHNMAMSEKILPLVAFIAKWRYKRPKKSTIHFSPNKEN